MHILIRLFPSLQLGFEWNYIYICIYDSGALSNNPSPTTTKKSATLPTNSTLSPTSMQKSATACELLQGNNQKRPSLQENILGSPFSTSSKEMSRSSTMPLSGDSEVGQNSKSGYFASLKSMVAIKSSGGGSKLSSLKATAAASTWMSPNSKKSLNEGYSSPNVRSSKE